MKSILLSICIIFTFLSCNNSNKENAKVIVIQPLGDFSNKHIKAIQDSLKNINPHTILRQSESLPQNAYFKPRNRYRADSLLKYLKQFSGPDTVVIGLTYKDISTTKGQYKDWGVMGLGYCPGSACVVSTFRLKKETIASQFYKVCVHELGHTQGLPHCKEKTCFMRDAEGGNPVDEETDFCPSCKKHLIAKGWKLK